MTGQQADIFMKYGDVLCNIECIENYKGKGLMGVETHALVFEHYVDFFKLMHIIFHHAKASEKEILTDYMCIERKAKTVTLY